MSVIRVFSRKSINVLSIGSSSCLAVRNYSSMIDQILNDVAASNRSKNNTTGGNNNNPTTTTRKPVFNSTQKNNNQSVLGSLKNTPIASFQARSKAQSQAQSQARSSARQTNHPRRRSPPQQHKPIFTLTSGTERLQQAFMMVYNQIRLLKTNNGGGYSRNRYSNNNTDPGTVLEITPKGLVETNFYELAQLLDLNKEGLEFIKLDEKNDNLPLVKRVTAQRANEIYSNYLHQQMTKDSGLIGKARHNNNANATDSSSQVKQYKLNWNVSLNDLINVKLKEISNQLVNKNCKVEIYIGDKRDLNNIGVNFLNEKEDASATATANPRYRVRELDEVEKIKREKLVDTIQDFITRQQELNKMEHKQKGSVLSKIMISLKLEKGAAAATNTNTNTNNNATAAPGNDNLNDKQRQKELKKQERRERERLKAMRNNGQ